MMSCSFTSGGSLSLIPLLLLSLLGSYGVIVLAQSQPKNVGLMGRLIGIFVMLVSISGLLCLMACHVCSWMHCGQ